MKKQKRKRVVQLYLPESGPPVPAWKDLPVASRDEVITVISEMLRQHDRPKLQSAGAGRHE
jgi:hypothetical protein